MLLTNPLCDELNLCAAEILSAVERIDAARDCCGTQFACFASTRVQIARARYVSAVEHIEVARDCRRETLRTSDTLY